MRSLSWLVIALALAACGGTGETIDAEGCTYLADGPFSPVTAGTAIDASAPVITAAAGAFTVTLPAAGVGYLAFDSPDDTEYAFFTSRTVTVAAFTAAGVNIPPSASATSSSVCTDIHGRNIIELPVGRFYVGLGPDAGGPVDLVLRPYNPD